VKIVSGAGGSGGGLWQAFSVRSNVVANIAVAVRNWGFEVGME
jgi:hypothetical protein